MSRMTESPEGAPPDERARMEAEVWRGIDRCRQGDWLGGLELLHAVAAVKGPELELPGRYYSYLGYGLARHEQRVKEGVSLCRHAVKIEPDEPENRLNLARLYELRGNRRGAWRETTAGLELAPGHSELLAFRARLDARRPPVLGFLPRTHPVNLRLGRLRHRWLRRGLD